MDDDRNAAIVLMNDGRGGFATPVVIPLGDKPNAVTIADATGDGKQDLIFSLPNTKRLMILPGNGDGTFGVPIDLSLPAAAGGVTTGDFTGSGHMDLAVSFPSLGKVGVLYGLGGGVFSAIQMVAVGKNPTNISTKDVTGNGRLDLVMANSGDGTTSVILNQYDPTKVYRYVAKAVDPDANPITYGLLTATGGMILNPTTGGTVWAPTADQLGSNAVTIQASNGHGGTVTQTFSIRVSAPAGYVAPVFTGTPPVSISADQPLSYTATAVTAKGTFAHYTLVNGPAGASIDPTTGVVTWDGRAGALDFNNLQLNSSYVTVPNSPSLDVSSITLEGWYQFSSTQNQVLISKNNSYILRYQYGQLKGLIGGTSGINLAEADYNWTPVVCQWYHMGMTFDSTNRVITLYVNGQAVSTQSTTQQIVNGNHPLALGVYGTSSDPFYGTMAAVRVYNTARTTADIRADLAGPADTRDSSLVADYEFAPAETDAGSLVTGGRDGRMRIWNAKGDKAADLGPADDAVLKVAFDSNAKTVFAGDWSGIVRMLPITGGASSTIALPIVTKAADTLAIPISAPKLMTATAPPVAPTFPATPVTTSDLIRKRTALKAVEDAVEKMKDEAARSPGNATLAKAYIQLCEAALAMKADVVATEATMNRK